MCVCVREVDIRRAIHTHVEFEWIMIKTERVGEHFITERVNEAQSMKGVCRFDWSPHFRG